MRNMGLLKGAKRVLALALTSAVLATALSGNFGGLAQVKAEDDHKFEAGYTQLGLEKISDVTYTDAVYLGVHPDTQEPLRYKVLSLNAKSGDYGYVSDTEDIMLLDCQKSVKQMAYQATGHASYWQSDIDKWLNNSFFQNSFSPIERSAIATVKHDPEYTVSNGYPSHDAVLDANVFILSSKEAGIKKSNTEYYKVKGISNWWVRSYEYPYDSNDPKYLCANSGGLVQKLITSSNGVSPALCLDKSKVVFATSMKGNSDLLKLTLRDSNITLQVNADAVRWDENGKIIVPYSLSGPDAGLVTAITAYFKLNIPSGTMQGYTKLNMSGKPSANGYGTVSLPTTAALQDKTFGTDYSMYVTAEILNGDTQTDYASNTVTVAKAHKLVFWGYGDTITASYQGESRSDEKMIVKAPANLTYDGKAKAATLNDYDKNVFSDVYKIEYYKDSVSGEKLAGAPKDVGKYAAKLTYADQFASVTFTITPGSSTVTAPTAKGLKDNGSAQQLVNAGTARNGTIKYALGTDNKTAPAADKFTTAIPTGKAEGTYYVWYRVDGDANYNGIAAKCVTVTIAHSHNLKKFAAKAATETSEGNKEYYYCDKCKKYFSDAEGKNEVQKGWWIINKLAHTHKLVKTTARAATETSEGNKEYYYCDKCKKYFSDADGKNEVQKGWWVIKKLTHTHKLKKIAAKEPKGSTNGNTAYWYCSGCKKYFADKNGKKEIKKNSWVVLAKNKTFKDSKSKGKYKVTSKGSKNPTAAYIGCTDSNAKSVAIPATVKYGAMTYKVTEVGKGALKGKTKIKTITVGSNVKKIGDQAFSDCSAVTKITLGKNVTTIGAEACGGCSSLKALTLPKNTRNLGKKFLNKCNKKMKLTIINTKMTKSTIKDGAFSGMTNQSGVTVIVPKGMKSSYKKLFKSKGLGAKITVKASTK